VKALREGCHEERRLGQVSPQVRTNKNLARATTKSKSETQTVSNGCVGRGEEMEVSRSIPMSETLSSEQDRSQVVLRAMSMGTRLMIIELEKYNEIRELLVAGTLWSST